MNGIQVLYLGPTFRFRWSAIDPLGLRIACQWISQSDLVIVHGFRGFAGTLLSMYARWKRKRCWICPHGMVQRRFRSIGLKWLFDNTCGRLAMRCYSAVLLYSPFEMRELATTPLQGCQFITIDAPVESEDNTQSGSFRKRHSIAEDDILILFVGRILKIKNLHNLLTAFAEVRESNWKLCYVGPHEDRQYARELEQLASILNCSNSFLLTGPLYGEVKNSAIRDANVCVLPSTYESFGHFAWEAANLGKPVVVTDQCGVIPMLGDRAHVCDSSSTSLGTALRAVIQGDDYNRPRKPAPNTQAESSLLLALRDHNITSAAQD